MITVCSSMVERRFHTAQVGGSSPPTSTMERSPVRYKVEGINLCTLKPSNGLLIATFDDIDNPNETIYFHVRTLTSHIYSVQSSDNQLVTDGVDFWRWTGGGRTKFVVQGDLPGRHRLIEIVKRELKRYIDGFTYGDRKRIRHGT